MTLAYTVCSANYLAHAKALADSVVAHNPGYQVVIALADTYRGYDPLFFAPHRVVPVQEMAIQNLDELAQRYTIFELSCALKPEVALYLLQTSACETLFYFDSDILVFHPLTAAEEALAAGSLLLTPHLCQALPAPAAVATELGVLRSGLYNAGFFGLRKNAEALAFLQWWRQRLLQYCFDKQSEGLFVDQLWLNFAPLYFSGATIFKHAGYNLAYWNFHERELSQANGQYQVNGEPLVFFHYSGHNTGQPQVLSKHQPLYNFEQLPLHQPLFAAYKKAVESKAPAQFADLPVTMGRPALPAPTREKNFFKRKWKKLLGRA